MTSTKKATSAFLAIKDKALPFPALKRITNRDNSDITLIPLYDLTESIEIDYSRFNSHFGFVKDQEKREKKIVAAFAVLCSIFGIFTITATIFYLMKIRPEELADKRMNLDNSRGSLVTDDQTFSGQRYNRLS